MSRVIPMVIEQNSRGEQAFDILSRPLRARAAVTATVDAHGRRRV
jgi:hypothetical protein